MELDRRYIMHALWPKRTGKTQEKLARDIGLNPSTYSALANTESTGIYGKTVRFTYEVAIRLLEHLESSNPEYVFFSCHEVREVINLDIFDDEQKENLLSLLSKNVPETYEQLPREILARELHTIHKELDKMREELRLMPADVKSNPIELDSLLYSAAITRIEQLLRRQGDLLNILFPP